MTNAINIQESYQDVINGLKQERDELRVKVHLAGMEIQDEWQHLESQWADLQAHGKKLSQATGESAHEIGTALGILGEELKNAYQRMKKAL